MFLTLSITPRFPSPPASSPDAFIACTAPNNARIKPGARRFPSGPGDTSPGAGGKASLATFEASALASSGVTLSCPLAILAGPRSCARDVPCVAMSFRNLSLHAAGGRMNGPHVDSISLLNENAKSPIVNCKEKTRRQSHCPCGNKKRNMLTTAWRGYCAAPALASSRAS